MIDKNFYNAKKIYDEIAKLCLMASFEHRETDSFKIYESIARKCYNLLIAVRDISAKEKYEEDDDVKNFNENVFKAYYLFNDIDEDYQRNCSFRAKLLEWRENVNAYDNLKAFSNQEVCEKNGDIEGVVNILKEVLSLLKEGDETGCIPQKIILLLDSISQN